MKIILTGIVVVISAFFLTNAAFFGEKSCASEEACPIANNAELKGDIGQEKSLSSCNVCSTENPPKPETTD